MSALTASGASGFSCCDSLRFCGQVTAWKEQLKQLPLWLLSVEAKVAALWLGFLARSRQFLEPSHPYSPGCWRSSSMIIDHHSLNNSFKKKWDIPLLAIQLSQSKSKKRKNVTTKARSIYDALSHGVLRFAPLIVLNSLLFCIVELFQQPIRVPKGFSRAKCA